MKWVIAIFAAALASVVQAQELKYAMGTLDYKNVGEHDCESGYEVPVRFVAEKVELEVVFEGQSKWVTERKGDTIRKIEVPSVEGISFPDSGFFLNLDITLCIAPFITTIATGRWKVWHESGQENLLINGVLPSDTPDTEKLTLFSTGYLGIAFDSSKDDAHARRSYKYGFHVLVEGLDFQVLRKWKDGVPLLIMPRATVAITTEPAHPQEEGKQ